MTRTFLTLTFKTGHIRMTIKYVQPWLNLLILLVSLLNPALSVASQTSTGELETTNSQGRHDLAILLDTQLSGDVNGMIANIKVDQVFQNQTDDWVNGRYVFPLPSGAAVDSLTIQIGERVIKGVIKEKSNAKKTFEAALRSGKKAGLLEQHRPNLFSISVANIAPQETVHASITFLNKVDYQNGLFSLRLPTTLTPRYIPGAALTSIQAAQQLLKTRLANESIETLIDESGWSANTDQVPDASAITPPQKHATLEQINNLFSLSLSVNAGFDLQSVSSETHAIDPRFINSKKVKVALANGQERMDSDLIVSWQAKIGNEPRAALFQQKFDDAYYSLMMVTPPSTNNGLSLARDITFVVDSSGSMAGGSMDQAKKALLDALGFLSSNDRFNIIDFDSDYRALFKRSQAVNQNTLTQARQMIDSLIADGGTEMMGALNRALSSDNEEPLLRQIVFITDGAIGNENALFELLNGHLGDARLFTVGIGRAPNAFFMRKAAQFGRGSYTYISDLSQVRQKMRTLFKRITHPILRNVSVDWKQDDIEQYPTRLPDLYFGEPLMVVVKSSRPLRNVTASGTMLNTAWKQTIRVNKQSRVRSRLNTIWARDKVDNLMDKLIIGDQHNTTIKPQVIELGIKHRIVTKFTSFVAIEETISKPDTRKAKHTNVANLMPKGSTMPVPQTATPTALIAIFGSVLMLLSLLCNRRVKRASGFVQ